MRCDRGLGGDGQGKRRDDRQEKLGCAWRRMVRHHDQKAKQHKRAAGQTSTFTQGPHKSRRWLGFGFACYLFPLLNVVLWVETVTSRVNTIRSRDMGLDSTTRRSTDSDPFHQARPPLVRGANPFFVSVRAGPPFAWARSILFLCECTRNVARASTRDPSPDNRPSVEAE